MLFRSLGGMLSEVNDARMPASKQALEKITTAFKQMKSGDLPPPNYADLESARQTLGSIAQDSKVNGIMNADGRLASRFASHIDKIMDDTPFVDARKAYQTQRKTEVIQRAIDTAENRATGTDGALKNEFRTILRNNIKTKMFTPTEVAAIRRVTKSGFIGNAAQFLGKFRADGGNNLVPSIGIGTGISLGHELAGVPGGIAGGLGAAGVAALAKAGSVKMVSNRANQARDIVAQIGRAHV